MSFLYKICKRTFLSHSTLSSLKVLSANMPTLHIYCKAKTKNLPDISQTTKIPETTRNGLPPGGGVVAIYPMNTVYTLHRK